MEAAGLAESRLGASVVIIRKSSSGYAGEAAPPPCPSVAVNGVFIVQNGTVTFEQLRDAISGKPGV